MANGSTKPGYAKADRFREQRATTLLKASEAIRRFRDSIADDDETPRQLIVNVTPHAAAPHSTRGRSISDSLRPIVEKVRTARRWVKVLAVVTAVLVPAVLETLRQIGALK